MLPNFQQGLKDSGNPSMSTVLQIGQGGNLPKTRALTTHAKRAMTHNPGASMYTGFFFCPVDCIKDNGHTILDMVWYLGLAATCIKCACRLLMPSLLNVFD